MLAGLEHSLTIQFDNMTRSTTCIVQASIKNLLHRKPSFETGSQRINGFEIDTNTYELNYPHTLKRN